MEPFLATLGYFAIGVIVVLIGLVIFEFITKQYNDWEEVKSGNQAVAMSIAGKIIGICIVLAFAIYHSFTIWDTLIWGIFGIVLQMAAYLLFEFFTKKFSVETELKNNNTAVGIISIGVSIGLAFVIGASIT
ncbi:DUF350 domain-containing protein [Halobacillus sp. Marseille-Q1614]|uniref:DUF350 domain-containing protein n=1 Tax=Halobacillus sp. Marseille-Q1614 TaxID=2709134 RepID=UPI00156EF5B8|nr:DUF350 domain-containing protein [Halobacillus sp. Marseille-Q1614]